MRFDSISPATRTVWAKSGDPAGHGLLAHMLDVAAAAERILSRESFTSLAWAADSFGSSPNSVTRWLASLIGLHDLGKSIAGFQSKWPEGRALDEAAGLNFLASQLRVDEHDKASAFELATFLSPYVGSRGRAAALAGAVAAHHGYVFSATEVKNARRVGEPATWQSMRAELFAAYWSTLGATEVTASTPLTLPALSWLAGLASVSDWIGSNVEWFPPCERDVTFTGHHAAALVLADQALDAIGWPQHCALLRGPADADQLIANIVGVPGLRSRPLQQAADRLLKDIKAPALMIIEAPMGEGKTELAMLAHLRLQAALGHRGLYIGLPTQATGNAMFDRTLRFLRAFGHDQPLDIQLAHGGAMLDDRLVELRGIHGAAGDSIRSSAWFSQRRRPLISPYGVGTIDQALFATLNVKHHFVRLWGLANRVVVLDEVHAYDTYTGGLIESLLRWLKSLGCSVVLMSATLPKRKRDALLLAWGVVPDTAPSLAYPRALLASGGAVRGESYPSRPLEPIELQAIDEELDSIAELAAALLHDGGCGAVVVNTVDRAQQLYQKLQVRLGGSENLMLFHARYPADERSAREHAVLDAFGKPTRRSERALLIATQVVEQSLDIDFDFLISDLAPVDLLLQRAGRLHRHDRARPPAHARPRLHVAGLLAQRLPELKKTAWGVIYSPYILGRTWAFVSRESRWNLPQDIDRLVQTIYGDDELPASIDAAAREFIEGEAFGIRCADEKTEKLFAQNAAIHSDDEPQNAYAGKPRGAEEGEGLGATNQTRLGEDSVTVVPVHLKDGAWHLHPDEPAFDPTIKPTQSLAKQILSRQLKLSRKAVIAKLKGDEAQAGFAEHPWLRDTKPLLLQDGVFAIGSLQVVLDPVLGIVYRSTADSAPTLAEENKQ